jgi:hypothetical protein
MCEYRPLSIVSSGGNRDVGEEGEKKQTFRLEWLSQPGVTQTERCLWLGGFDIMGIEGPVVCCPTDRHLGWVGWVALPAASKNKTKSYAVSCC